MLRERFNPEIAAFLSGDEWLVSQENYVLDTLLDDEARFGLVNGRMGNRASNEEGDARLSLPATYIHGVFDRSEAFMRELCNVPNWNLLKLSVNGRRIGPESGEMTGFLRVLDMKNGLLAKRYVMKDRDGRETLMESLKCLSRVSPRRAFLRVYVRPLNYEGSLYIENCVDGSVCNFADMPRFKVKHLLTEELGALPEGGAYVGSRTRDFKLPVGVGARVQMSLNGAATLPKSPFCRAYGETACEFLDAFVKAGQTLRIDKYAALATGRDCADVKSQVRRELEAAISLGFDDSIALHQKALQALWERADVQIKGDDRMQKALRFNLYHLMNTPDPSDERVSVGAKLLHGEEYGGHSYWDTELFVLPFFSFTFPKIARSLLSYRYHLLPQARRNAQALGFSGAKYPWESADTGEEECPDWTIEYDGSLTRCLVALYEHHVTSAVAYGVSQYARVSGDQAFMLERGLEIMLETARFWASRMVYNEALDRYEIHKVTGPDEWHEGVDNNAYTNHLARWNLEESLKRLEALEKSEPERAQALREGLDLQTAETESWKIKAKKLFLQAEEGLIEQFDGYFDLDEALVTAYDENGMPLPADNPKNLKRDQRKMIKQADVVMLLQLLTERFSHETLKMNFEYYERRTRHSSSLSPCIYAMVGLKAGLDGHAYRYLERSAYVDIDNNQKNTREGIHAASAGGTWQCVTLGFCGMDVGEDGLLSFKPRLPRQWQEVRFSIEYRGALRHIRVDSNGVKIESEGEAIQYKVGNEMRFSGPIGSLDA